MTFKRFLAAILSTAMVATLFAGCGKKPEASAATQDPSAVSTSESSSANEAANIIWAGWSGEEESSKAIFADTMVGGFNAKNTGTTVSWVGWPWAETLQQLLIRNQGSEQLDIAQVDISMFASLAAADVLVDFNEILGKEYLENNFHAASLAVGMYEGKQLGMPWSIASIGMLYNPEVLKKAGWDNPPVTVEEFEKCLADVAALGDDIIPYGVATKDATAAGDFAPWLWTFGGNIYGKDGSVTINNEAAAKTVNWYKGLLEKNYIRMNIGRMDSRQLFAQGKMAFYDDAVLAKGVAVKNGVDQAKVNDVCRPMLRPTLKSGDAPQSTMWGHMLVIFKKSTYQKQAGKFAKHLVSEDVSMKYFENNGMPPVLKSVLNSDTIKNDPYASAFMDITKNGRLEETALNPKNGEIKTIITEELQAALLNDKETQKALDDMAARINSVK